MCSPTLQLDTDPVSSYPNTVLPGTWDCLRRSFLFVLDSMGLSLDSESCPCERWQRLRRSEWCVAQLSGSCGNRVNLTIIDCLVCTRMHQSNFIPAIYAFLWVYMYLQIKKEKELIAFQPSSGWRKLPSETAPHSSPHSPSGDTVVPRSNKCHGTSCCLSDPETQ